MLTFYKKYWKTAFDIGLLVATILLIMWIFSFLYDIAAPIFWSFLIFALIEPLAKFLNRKGMKKSIASAISIVLFIVILLGLLVGAGIIFITQISNLINYLNGIDSEVIMREVQAQYEYWSERFAALDIPEDALDKASEWIGTVLERAADLSVTILNMLYSWLTSFSNFIVNFVIGVVLAYFLSVEIDSWKRIAREKTPKTFKAAFFFLRDNVLKGLVTYMKSQFKLISVTFVMIFVGLMVLGLDNAFSIAVISAILDLLPLLGVTMIFIPWSLFLFAAGDHVTALCLLVLLVIVLIVRQILEPKITGDSLGVSAFTMLSFMIISLSLFGVAGLVLSPVLVILVKSLHDQGYLQQWIRRPEDY